MMNIAILTIGDEICIGQVVNTNAAKIASRLTEIGANVVAQSTVGDSATVLLGELDRLRAIANVVVCTGGLGPTHDDVTKSVLCTYFNDTLELRDDVLAVISELVSRRGMTLSDRNREQAMQPSRSVSIVNDFGTAPGIYIEDQGFHLFALPGVPTEMQHMLHGFVSKRISELMELAGSKRVVFRTLMTSGITEAALADLIGDPLAFLQGASLAFLPSPSGVRLRIGVSSSSADTANVELERIENVLCERAGDYVFARNGETLVSVVARLCRQKKVTVAVAESCTGGLVGMQLSELAGSSVFFRGGFIVYQDEMKILLCGVKHRTLYLNGAVSERTAVELADGARLRTSSDYALSITGWAGPDGGTTSDPVGTIWIGLASPSGTTASRFVFGKDRATNRERAASAALLMLLRALQQDSVNQSEQPSLP